MKKTKLIFIAAILIAFAMTLNAFGQNGSQRKSRSNKNARSAKSKGPKTTNFSFGVSNGWVPVGNSGLSAGRTRRKKRKSQNAKVQYNDWHFSKDRRKSRKR